MTRSFDLPNNVMLGLANDLAECIQGNLRGSEIHLHRQQHVMAEISKGRSSYAMIMVSINIYTIEQEHIFLVQ